jgi:hypothetical protein
MDPKVEHRYRSLEEVVAAYARGELDESTPLVISPQETGVYLAVSAQGTTEEKAFDGGSPDFLLQQALSLLHVPYKVVEPSALE